MTYFDPQLSRYAAQEVARQRSMIEATVEHLIGLLDALDAPFEDLEDNGDLDAVQTTDGWSG